MADDSGSGSEEERKVETKGQMTQRHKREAMMLKKQVAKLGKKKKDEAKRLEQDLQTRHKAELEELEKRLKDQSEAAAASTAAPDQNDSQTNQEGEQKEKKVSRAQKRREAKAAKEAEREARIALERASMGETLQDQEQKKMEELLLDLSFVIHDIPPDGHCMFRSLEDQLSFQSTHALGFQHSPVDYLGLRKMAADHIRGNKEQFEAFLELPLEEYCDQMETTAEWGGHLELQAISAALGVCIEVYSADQPLLKIGEEHEGAPLRIAYHLHAYGLGEHYNSVRPITT